VLEQLRIRNFAIIDQLELTWQPGLTVITGETGAGKSIIIDAVGALLGDRLGPEVVRSGADKALIEGIFAVLGEPRPELKSVLEEYGLEPEDGALIVSREVAGGGGRGGARINGRTVPLAVLQELGEQLVDVHGQSQHMALLRTREQLDYLDRFGGVGAERQRVGGLVRELRATRETRRKLLAEERESVRLQEMLRHEVAEIERAELHEGEDDELQALRTRLQHVERLRQAASTAHAALMGSEADQGDQPGAVDLLGEAVAACQDGARFDPGLAGEADTLNQALAQA
jgi:DNA repair protein RecN (Recombination protein N)